MNTPTKYKLLKGTYEQLGYSFVLEDDGRKDWHWEVAQHYVRGECQESAKGISRTKVRAMKATVAALLVIDDS